MLLFEIRMDGRWRELGRLETGDAPGSLSHNGPAGRQVYQFQCHGDYSVLERSLGGADTEVGPMRVVLSDGFERVAILRHGETEEFWLKTDRMNAPHRVRFTHT